MSPTGLLRQSEMSYIHTIFYSVGREKSVWWLSHWIGLCSVLRPRQHSIGYMGDRWLSQFAWHWVTLTF